MYLVQTVQTASPWRPQLPLPKDITAHVQQQQRQQAMEKATPAQHKAKDGGKDKKWSLGSLFRKKKKEIETDSSSEEDRKAGFVPVKSQQGTLNGKRKKRSSRIVSGGGFDHIVVNQQQQQQQHQHQHIIAPHQVQQPNQYGFRESDSVNGSLDRRSRAKTDRSSRHSKERQSSSDEESHRSSSMSRFRSDDSLGNHSAGSHRKSRTARTERYLKRMSRDDGGSPQGVPGVPAVSRWHTQPISPSMVHGGSVQSMDVAYRRHPPHHHNHHHQHQHHHQPHGGQLSLRNSASLSNVPHQLYQQSSSPNYAQQLQLAYGGAPPAHHNPPAVTYENSFYIQSKASSIRDAIRSPPPIPPRDPQRRLTIGHTNEARPVSYAFDRYQQPPGATVWQSNGKCNSEDRLWGSPVQAVQRTPPCTTHTVTPPRASSVQPAEVQQQQQQHRQRYISRQQQPPVTNTIQPPSTPPSSVAYHHHQNHQHQQQQQQQSHPQHHYHATLPATPPQHSVEYRYVTDVTPRSRKPIQIQDRTFEPYEPKLPEQAPTGSESSLAAYTSSTPTPSGGRVGTSSTRSLLAADSSDSLGAAGSRTPQQSASAFWRRIEEEQQHGQPRRGRATERRPGVAGAAISSRSVSTSRALEIMNRRNQELTRELDHLLDDKQSKNGCGEREVESVVSGRLYLRQTADGTNRGSKSNEKLYEVKMKPGAPEAAGGNRYEEHVAKTVAQGAMATHGYRRYGEERRPHQPPAPPMRTISKRNSCSEEELVRKRKSANLEEAINELEAIYKSLKLSDEDLLERAERRDLPTPTGFSQRARHYRYDGDADEERPKAEPDLQLDDLSYRSIKRANSSIKAPDTQPPFGIPVGPIPPSPCTDYLTVQAPAKQAKPRFQPQRSPDLVADDLAFRQLRKDKDLLACIDRAGAVGRSVAPPSGNTSSGSDDSRPKRSSGSLSSNIYSQIQRDAAKPSGGNLEDYYKIELYAKSLREATAPGPKPKEPSPAKDKSERPSPVKENRGAVFNLPSTLKSSSPARSPGAEGSSSSGTTPTPRPRSGTEPVIVGAKHKAEFEEILNAIALEAQTTSEKLGADLAELRKETQSVSSGTSPDVKKAAVRAVTKTIAPVGASATSSNEVDEVAEAAKYCEKMLRDVIEEAPRKEPVVEAKIKEVVAQSLVLPEPPAIVEPTPDSVALSGLIEQLTPAGSFEALSKRCQDQLTELEAEDEHEHEERVKSSIERDYESLVESIKPFESDTEKKSTEEEIDLIMKECGIELEPNEAPKVAVPASAQTDDRADRASERKSSESEPNHRQRSSSGSPAGSGSAERGRKSSRPSPPVSSVRMTPSDTESQYNSSEELAMIFGITSPTPPTGKGASGAGVCVPVLSLSCAQPPAPQATVPPTDEHDGGDGADGGVILSVPVPSVSFHNHSPSTTTTSTVASVVCAVSATNSIACNNVVTTNTNTTTDTQTHDDDTNTTTTVGSVANEEEPPVESFYLRSSFSSSQHHLHHSLDTIHEDLAEEEEQELEETTAADVDSTTTDSGNVSLNDFGAEFVGTERKALTYVNEVQIERCGGTGYYPFRSVLQIPEIFIEDVSGREESEPERCEDEPQPAEVEDPEVETLEELERLERERRRLEDVESAERVRQRAHGSSGASGDHGGSSSSADGGATKRKSSSSSSLVQPQHVVLACTYGLANSSIDYITVIAIIIAIVTLFALMVL